MTQLGSHVGLVKWFDPKKGYGFIVGPEEQDVFAHFTQIGGDGFRALKDGESVSYVLLKGDKGYQAQNIQHLDIQVNKDAQPPHEAAKPPKIDAP